MTKSGKSFIAIILTYGLRRLGFWIFEYEPFSNNSQYVGIAIDIAIWGALFYLIVWVLDKVIATKES